MGILYMDNDEHELNIKFIAEASHLLGQPAKLYQIDKKSYDLQNDPEVSYLDPVGINFLFEENPKPVLKRNNWYSDSDSPYIGYFTISDTDYNLDLEVDTECLVEIYERIDKTKDKKLFRIANLAGSKLDPLFWTCNLVPYHPRTAIEELPDIPEGRDTSTGYSYIKNP